MSLRLTGNLMLNNTEAPLPTFFEFFAGGGMVRAGLGSSWTCAFANDFDHKKGEAYKANWGSAELVVDDIRNVGLDDLPDRADLAWGSFPCQDLSLAGGGAGLKGDRSGTFYPFVNIMRELSDDGRAPRIIALENVVGTLTSHKGADFRAICSALDELGYKFGALVVDASAFLPQSRPRLFVIAVHSEVQIPDSVMACEPCPVWHTKGLRNAFGLLPKEIQSNWIWWQLPTPPAREVGLADVIEENPSSVSWHSTKETTSLLSMMSEVNLAKVETAKHSKTKMVGTIYKRTRWEHGIKVQRAEIRFDDVAGCLRTPAGGSSRQLIMVVEGNRIRSRLMSSRETARLMGLPETYKLPEKYNQAYHLTGDGVAVPVVSHLSKHIFQPCLVSSKTRVEDHESNAL